MSDLTTIDLSIDRWRLGEARLVKIAWGPSWFLAVIVVPSAHS